MNWINFDDTLPEFSSPCSFNLSEPLGPRRYPGALPDTSQSFSEPPLTSTKIFSGDSSVFFSTACETLIEFDSTEKLAAPSNVSSVPADFEPPLLSRAASAADVTALPARGLSQHQLSLVRHRLARSLSARTFNTLNFFNRKPNFSNPHLPEHFKSHETVLSLPDSKKFDYLVNVSNHVEVSELTLPAAVATHKYILTNNNPDTNTNTDKDTNTNTRSPGGALSPHTLKVLKSRHGIDLANVKEGPRTRRQVKKA